MAWRNSACRPRQPRSQALWRAYSAALCLMGCLGCWVIPGCGGSPSYTPPEGAARSALEAALEAWKGGAKAGSVKNPPAGLAKVQAVDSDWSAGRKLAAYEIVGETASGQGPMQFDVKLTIRNQKPKEVAYFVVGRDPVWVFRDKDYQQSKGM